MSGQSETNFYLIRGLAEFVSKVDRLELKWFWLGFGHRLSNGFITTNHSVRFNLRTSAFGVVPEKRIALLLHLIESHNYQYGTDFCELFTHHGPPEMIGDFRKALVDVKARRLSNP